MTEITLETIDEKEDRILIKLDELLDLVGLYDSKLVEILAKVNGLTPPTEPPEDDEEPTGQFKEELEAKINEGLPYDQVKEFIISKLEELGIYSEDDVVIKIFVHKTGDLMLEIKTRPHPYFGKVLDFFQQSLGDADYFETSRYEMRVIQWWRLTKNMQMSEQTSDSSIIDVVNEDWQDRDDVNAHLR